MNYIKPTAADKMRTHYDYDLPISAMAKKKNIRSKYSYKKRTKRTKIDISSAKCKQLSTSRRLIDSIKIFAANWINKFIWFLCGRNRRFAIKHSHILLCGQTNRWLILWMKTVRAWATKIPIWLIMNSRKWAAEIKNSRRYATISKWLFHSAFRQIK